MDDDLGRERRASLDREWVRSLEQSARHLLQDRLETLDPKIPDDARIRERPRSGAGLWEASRPELMQQAAERFGQIYDEAGIVAVVETAIRLQARHQTESRHLTAEEWMRTDSTGTLEWILAWRAQWPTKTGTDLWEAYSKGFTGKKLKRSSVENYYYVAGARLGLSKPQKNGKAPAGGATSSATHSGAADSREPTPTPPAKPIVPAPAADPQADVFDRVAELARRQSVDEELAAFQGKVDVTPELLALTPPKVELPAHIVVDPPLERRLVPLDPEQPARLVFDRGQVDRQEDPGDYDPPSIPTEPGAELLTGEAAEEARKPPAAAAVAGRRIALNSARGSFVAVEVSDGWTVAFTAEQLTAAEMREILTDASAALLDVTV